MREPADKLNKAAVAKGHCCIYSLLKGTENVVPRDVLAEVLGVSPETIKKARRRLRDGLLSCRTLPNCYLPTGTSSE